MASLNAPGGPVVVPKQLVGFRSYGRNIAITSGTNVHAQSSVRATPVNGVPAYARASGDFGTQSSPATESFIRLRDGLIKHTESVGDTVVQLISGTVPVDGNTQAEIALSGVAPLRKHHTGARIVEQNTITDEVVRRISNVGETPGGEI